MLAACTLVNTVNLMKFKEQKSSTNYFVDIRVALMPVDPDTNIPGFRSEWVSIALL